MKFKMEGVVEDMWSPYKHLHSVFKISLANPQNGTSDLELCLKKYKQNFTNFLRNPPKNEKSRTHLRSALIEGVALAGQTRKVQLSSELIDEAFIISDMFDLDEIVALELLCSAHRQQMHHPGLPRGLVAILLYYDGRKAISRVLQDMFQTVNGVSWSTDLPIEFTSILTSYAQTLVDESNILGRLIDLIGEMDLDKEMVLLTKNRAFGPKKHQNQVIELFEETRKACAMAIFNWSAQRGLPKEIAIRLLEHLAVYRSIDATDNIDDITLIVLMTLLYAYDTSVLLIGEANHSLVPHLPIICDAEFTKNFYDALYSQPGWQIPRLDAIVKYSFGLTLASLRHAPMELQTAAGSMINNDEQLVDEALAANVFGIMYRYLLDKEIIYTTEFIYRRVHMLITDFIDYMHSKVTELRGRADETARTIISFSSEGFEPPTNLDNNFELLMLCVSKLYSNPLCKLTLCDEFWGATDSKNTVYLNNTSRSISLYKFISLASELLPSTLFKPYIKMITGLTHSEFSSRSAYNLLKQTQNETTTFSVSWDHFFTALSNYYTNMRNDNSANVTVLGDSVIRSRPQIRHITPRETESLIAVVQIMRAVSNYDEIPRVMLCKHSNWLPPQLLIGLITCATPLQLKAEILLTLAAMAKSKQTARIIWFNMEDVQLIPTTGIDTANNNFAQCSLAEEIEQTESRAESYKLTLGILELLYSLMSTHMPSTLGTGARKPGYDAYYFFVQNVIAVKFYGRAYKDPVEKWEVGAKCFKLMYYLLSNYKPDSADFLEVREENPHPGFHIMLQLHLKSDIVRLLLRIIEEARELFDDYSKFRGKDLLEECSLYALLLIENALDKQNAFFEAHSAVTSSILLSGLNRMLMDINPRTNEPDFLLNITKYVTYNSWLPQHTLAAVKILTAVTMMPAASAQILNMYAMENTEMLQIRQGFVECIDMEGSPVIEEEEEKAASQLQSGVYKNAKEIADYDQFIEKQCPLIIELQIKEAIINLFEVNINQSVPNFVFFLLGIDVVRDFMSTEKPYVEMNACIHSLVYLLERNLAKQRTSDCYCEQTAHIVERTYHLFQSLCAHRRTSEKILRYFRLTCNDFLLRHLSAMPFKHHQKDNVLHSMSYVISSVAIEIKLCATYGQTTRFNLLCDILLGTGTDPAHASHTLPLECTTTLVTPPPHSLNFYGIEMLPSIMVKPLIANPGLHANRLLDCIEFDSQSLSHPRLEFFDAQQASQLLRNCESKAPTAAGNTGNLINLRKLHAILYEELRMVQTTIVSGQRKSIVDEISALLNHATKLNRLRTKRFAALNFMTSWCQLIQMLFSCMPEQVVPIGVRKQHIIDIIEKILMKVAPVQPLIDMSIQVTETILLLLANLRVCYYQLEDQLALDEHGNVVCVDSATGTVCTVDVQHMSNKTNLRYILRQIIEWIMLSEVKSQKLRINLYVALLNCLRILRRQRTDEQLDYTDCFLSRLDKTQSITAMQMEDRLQREMAAEMLADAGESLMDAICHDAVSGHDVCRLLALSCLDIIVELSAISTLCDFMHMRGYFRQILDSIGNSNASLCSLLQPNPDQMRALYIYESHMSFLTRLAHVHVGASMVLSEHTLGTLSNMSVYDMQPDLKVTEIKKNEPQSFIPTADERFRSILMPALSFCDALLNTLGSSNNSAALQVLNFLFSHIDMVEAIMRTATPFMSVGYLQQVSVITNLLARTTTHDIVTLENNLDVNNDLDLHSRLIRLQQLMVVVFARFTLSDSTVQQVQKLDQENLDDSQKKKNLHLKYFLDITANLSLYCRNAVTSHSKESMVSKYLLTTMINDVTPLTGSMDSKKLTGIIQVILNHLKGAVSYYLSQKTIADNLLQQRSSLPSIAFGPNGKQTYLELSQRHSDKRNELMQAVFIAEQNTYLLWIHLDFYLRNAVIYTRENRNAINESNLDPNNMSVLNASHDEIVQLKQMLIAAFNETFCEQLVVASDSYTIKCKNFTAALVRRIKALVQFAPINEKKT